MLLMCGSSSSSVHVDTYLASRSTVPYMFMQMYVYVPVPVTDMSFTSVNDPLSCFTMKYRNVPL